MNKNYADQENMEEMGLKEESISKKNEKNVNERHDQDGQRYKEGTVINGDRERQENDGQRYRDGTPLKDNREVQQQDGKIYVDHTSMNDEKEYRQKNGDSNPEQDERFYQKAGQKESPINQGYRN